MNRELCQRDILGLITDMSPQAPWVRLYDEKGKVLEGILGKKGSSAVSAFDNLEMGLDIVKMTPGSGFPLHTHSGGHILYLLSGRAQVVIGGQSYDLNKQNSIYIPAHLPHGVQTIQGEYEEVIFLAFGHPHKHIQAKDRMKYVDDR